jgi:hypothetical protein
MADAVSAPLELGPEEVADVFEGAGRHRSDEHGLRLGEPAERDDGARRQREVLRELLGRVDLLCIRAVRQLPGASRAGVVAAAARSHGDDGKEERERAHLALVPSRAPRRMTSVPWKIPARLAVLWRSGTFVACRT